MLFPLKDWGKRHCRTECLRDVEVHRAGGRIIRSSLQAEGCLRLKQLGAQEMEGMREGCYENERGVVIELGIVEGPPGVWGFE